MSRRGRTGRLLGILTSESRSFFSFVSAAIRLRLLDRDRNGASPPVLDLGKDHFQDAVEKLRFRLVRVDGVVQGDHALEAAEGALEAVVLRDPPVRRFL